MAPTQTSGFVHSIPVPRVFKIASKIARKVRDGEDSLKNLIYACREREVKSVYALVVETFKRNDIIDDLIQKSQLLVKEPRLDIWLAKISIWDLLWGKRRLQRGGCKPFETILNYEKVLRDLLEECKDTIQPVLKYDILKPRYVRVNTLKITIEDAVNNFIDEGWRLVRFWNNSNYQAFQDCLNNLKNDEFIKDIHIPDLLIFPPKTQFHQHEAYKSGCLILQDKASCLSVHLLAPTPGSIVLDTCAAPGMKTTQMAALLQNEGTVYAVEVSAKREGILRQIVESAGATCVKTILKDVMEVKDNICPDVEYILVDPSCSGSGITDRIEIEKLDLDTRIERLKKLCNFQAKLLRHTMKSFPKARRIVYSTCSVNSEENEDVVRQILETSREFKLVNAKERLSSWNSKSSEIYPELGNMCIFATPKEDKTNGFFVAVFERLQDGDKNPYLNYELCKLFDRESRKHNNDDIPVQKDTQSSSYENFEKTNEESLDSEIFPVNSRNKSTSKSTMKTIKDKKMKIEGDSNIGQILEYSDSKTQKDDVDIEQISVKKEKKKKKYKLKNENTDSIVENFKNEDNTDTYAIQLDTTPLKKIKNELATENENTYLNPDNSLVSDDVFSKKKNNDSEKEENTATYSFTENHVIKKEKRERSKSKKLKDDVDTDSIVEESIAIEGTYKEKKRKNRTDELNKEDTCNTNSIVEESIEIEGSFKEKKRKNRTDKLNKEDTCKNSSHIFDKEKKEKNKTKQTVTINTDALSEDTMETGNKEKRKKNKKIYKEGTGETDMRVENLDNTVMKKKKEKKIKNKKLDMDNENTDLSNHKIERHKRNKHLDRTENGNIDTILENSVDTLKTKKHKNCHEETKTNTVLDLTKREKTKKRKKISDGNENFEPTQENIDQGIKPKVKKVKK